MSTIRCDNFGPSSGGTSYSARGIAKAWVNFNGTGTIAARDSENVSSLTDVGVGNYDINFSNSFSSSSYGITVGTRHNSTGGLEDFASQTASLVTLRNVFTSDGSPRDDDNNNLAVLGDLA